MPPYRVLRVLLLITVLATSCGPVTIIVGEDTPDVGSIVQATFAAMTAAAGPATTPQATVPAPGAETGSISGSLGYPSESIPAMYVTAFQVGTANYQYVATVDGQATYTISGLAPGTYHVVAYTVGGGSFPAGLAGGYTKAVICGLGVECTDHGLVDIQVGAGQAVSGISPNDWYFVEGAFPPFPGTASLTPTQAIALGGISGSLMYPSSGIPALRIVAFQSGTNAFYYVDTIAGQSDYSIGDLPTGTYHVVAYVIPGGGYAAGPAGGYSQMVPCGLKYGCNDHTLIDVIVTAGNVTTGVDPNDYYADPGTFPPNPVP